MPFVKAYSPARYDPAGKVFWRVIFRHPCFVVQRRKVHEVSRVLHGLVQAVNRLWESNPQPYRIVLLNEQHSIVAKASNQEEIKEDFEKLVTLFGVGPRDIGSGDVFKNFIGWKKQTLIDIPKFSANPIEEEKQILRKQGKSPRAPATMDDTWNAFLERSFHLGKYAMERGILPQEDLEEFSPYLYLGLPSLTFLQTLLRSQGLAGFAVGEQKELVDSKLPENLKPLYADLKKLKEKLASLKATEYELDQMHKMALFQGEHETELKISSVERKAAINNVLSGINSVAIRVSQLKFYLKSFNDVLLRLGELDIKDPKPNLERQWSWLGTISGVGKDERTENITVETKNSKD